MARPTPIRHGHRGPDLYELLGVSHDADASHIGRAYREKVRALRLDVSQGPEVHERLGELTHAYTVLSNRGSRLLYDRVAGGGRRGLAPEEPGAAWPQVDEDLIDWVLASDQRQERQPTPAATSPAGDTLVRFFATAGFVSALVLLLVLIMRG